ncbi:MAG: DUF1565 domain-containing protein [Leptospiraceae bacterium]|nr:DUF1565 domain-containing protein [Leptospiraceae bacterium]
MNQQIEKCSMLSKKRQFPDDKKYPTPYDELIPSNYLYVSKSGNDTNSGTAEKPLQTIQSAIDKSDAGTAIMVSEGVYEESISFGNKKGRLDAPIWLQSKDGSDKAIIKSSKRDTVSGWGANHIILSGFKIYGGVIFGPSISPPYTPENVDCKYIVVKKNTIRSTTDRALAAAGCLKVYYLENHICDSGTSIFRTTDAGIDIVTVNDTIIARNTVYDSPGNLIVVKGGSTDSIIAENYLFNLPKVAISAGQSSTESLMWPEALSEKFEGKRITVKENEILASPNRQLAVQFMACVDCTLEKNIIHAKSDYFTDVGLVESYASHSKGSGWLPRNISLRNNCVGRLNWLFKEEGVGEPTENSNNNSVGCN